MPKQYNKSEIIDRIEEIIKKKQVSALYKEPYMKRKGKTKEREFYSEVASQKLLDENIEILLSEQVRKIPRENYKLTHKGRINNNSNRREEILAITLKGKDLHCLGHIIEYQIPLKSKNSDKGAGKIDLVSIDYEANKAFIIELKAKNNKEGLLKAVLEIATYERQLNMDNFRRDVNIPREFAIKKVVLLEDGSQGCAEVCGLAKRPYLRSLIKHLEIGVFLLKGRGRLNVVPIRT